MDNGHPMVLYNTSSEYLFGDSLAINVPSNNNVAFTEEYLDDMK